MVMYAVTTSAYLLLWKKKDKDKTAKYPEINGKKHSKPFAKLTGQKLLPN